jgi:hypothetical protein
MKANVTEGSAIEKGVNCDKYSSVNYLIEYIILTWRKAFKFNIKNKYTNRKKQKKNLIIVYLNEWAFKYKMLISNLENSLGAQFVP